MSFVSYFERLNPSLQCSQPLEIFKNLFIEVIYLGSLDQRVAKLLAVKVGVCRLQLLQTKLVRPGFESFSKFDKVNFAAL